MTSAPIDDIETWSMQLSLWRQDCLRRLAVSNEITEVDLSEMLAMIKHSAGFTVDTPPPTPIPFDKGHFGSGERKPIVLKGVSNVQNVNRLMSGASLTFCPKALTIVYGRNGSGKSGFVRILRTACRTRIENPAKLKVLADVYGGGAGSQTAEITIDAGEGDTPVVWSSGMSAAPELMQVSVFDTASAQLYVDGGNQIRYLPFGLALPHRLNTVCLTLKERLDAERATAVGDKVNLTAVMFSALRETKAQLFDKGVTKSTTDAAIENATQFPSEDQSRLDSIIAILSAGSAAAADLSSLATWVTSVADECEVAYTGLSDAAHLGFKALKDTAVATRRAAELAASALFTDDPLPGVGNESWRALWAAARDYSINDAYVGRDFPVIAIDDGTADCVLCQQPLLPDGIARMRRFQKYMDDTLDIAATGAERAVIDATGKLIELKLLQAGDFLERLEQVRTRDEKLAEAVATFRSIAMDRRAAALAYLGGEDPGLTPALEGSHVALKALAVKLKNEKEQLTRADNAEERQKLLGEKAELEDRKVLTANRDKLTTRRNLLFTDAAYLKALVEVQTKAITQRANELLDTHLTKAVVAHFDAERDRFDIMHLKVGLARKSGQTKAEFEMNPQTKLTKVTSEILSEGEQRALALAGFLTEVRLTDGAGPVIIDDPVSSLDRDRSVKVAERLAEEALQRQVVVFTHDLIFFNELCRAADAQGIEPVTIALFSDKNAAGKVDGAGVVWKGLNVAKRIGKIRNDSAPLGKLHSTSPAEYEVHVKNLYGRLRDTYERTVEEVIFRDIVRRGADVVQTQLLRYVTLSHTLAVRFHEGMTRANTHSHDNPASETVPVPTPQEFASDLVALEQLIVEMKNDSELAEAARPQMKPKK